MNIQSMMSNIFPIWKLEGFFDTVFVKNWPKYLFFLDKNSEKLNYEI